VGNGRAPPTRVCGFVKVPNQRVIVEDAAYLTAQGSGALSVDDPDLRQSLLVAGTEVLRHETSHVGRIEDVEVQDTIDRVLFHRGAGLARGVSEQRQPTKAACAPGSTSASGGAAVGKILLVGTLEEPHSVVPSNGERVATHWSLADPTPGWVRER